MAGASSLLIESTNYSLNILPLNIALPYFFVLIAVELFAHWHHYAQRDRTSKHQKHNQFYRINDAIASLSSGVCEQLLSKMFTSWWFLFTYAYIYHHFRFFDFEWVNRQDYFWSWCGLHVLAFFLKDAGYYAFHRSIHESSLLWYLHECHHSSEHYNLTTALRQGMFQSVAGPLFYIPMSLLGIPPQLYAFHTMINLLYQFWIHSRSVPKLPWIIEYIFNTPSHHRAHHGRNPEYIDKNYGGTLIIFDRLFNTFEEEKREVVYGLVHPLQSFNPLTSQFNHIKNVFSMMKSVGFQPIKWILVCVKGPGYNAVDGTEFPLPDVDETNVSVYDPQLTYSDSIYSLLLLFNSVILSLLFISGPESTSLKVCHGFYSFWVLISLGFINDGDFFRSLMIEGTRCIYTIVSLVFTSHSILSVFSEYALPTLIVQFQWAYVYVFITSIMSFIYLVFFYQGTGERSLHVLEKKVQ